jgi:hypothetical protein
VVARQISDTRPAAQRADTAFEDLLAPLLTREIAAIAALDAAIAAEKYPDYVVMFRGTKNGKQANVEQMATLIRRRGGVPPEHGGLRKYVLKTQSAIAERVAGTTVTLQAMRTAEVGLLKRYTETIKEVDGLARQALRKALGRTLVHCHVLTAHIAKRTGTAREAESLPQPLDRYFAGPTAKACMRCHLDRPGALPALKRRDPHPYTYICAGCHVDVRAEFPPDLASQMDRWPRRVQEAGVLQHAIGRPSVLNAIHTVLYPLSGLVAEAPVRAEEKAVLVPALEPPPTPAADETPAVLAVEPRTTGEAAYVAALFDYRSVRASW